MKFIQLKFYLYSSYFIHSIQFPGWISISGGSTISQTSIKNQWVQIKTIGEGHFDLHFRVTGAEEIGFQCDLLDSTTSTQFKVHMCSISPGCCMMTNIPATSTRIWTFSLTSTMLHLECEGDGEKRREVMSVSQTQLSSCINAEKWKYFLGNIEVYSDDEVTKAYRILGESRLQRIMI